MSTPFFKFFIFFFFLHFKTKYPSRFLIQAHFLKFYFDRFSLCPLFFVHKSTLFLRLCIFPSSMQNHHHPPAYAVAKGGDELKLKFFLSLLFGALWLAVSSFFAVRWASALSSFLPAVYLWWVIIGIALLPGFLMSSMFFSNLLHWRPKQFLPHEKTVTVFCLQSQYRRNCILPGRMGSDIQNRSQNSSLSIPVISSRGIFVPSANSIHRPISSIFLSVPLLERYAPPSFFSSGTK